jgi:ubiquinone/menaquinone biosynthesis C-methylase UbiE
MRSPPIPAYIDGLIAAYRAGHAGRDLHLGYWDNPPDLTSPCGPGEFRAAQARLTECALDLAPVQAGNRVLDVACGFGGTLARLAGRCPKGFLVGLNIDPRQLELCRDVDPAAGGGLALTAGDACALPFADGAFDHVLCVEAMFHFRSRRGFFFEAARVLRQGGSLVVTDILLSRRGAGVPWGDAIVEAALSRDYGPWPEPWLAPTALAEVAAAQGFAPIAGADWTWQTLPSYRIVAPAGQPSSSEAPDAGTVLRRLHEAGRLTYQAMALRRL